MKVLITGGAGYIGSVTARALEVAGHQPVVLDSLVTGTRAFVADRLFYEGDIADHRVVERVFADHPDIAATIHMAARVVVADSLVEPALYYRDNVGKSLEFFDHLARLGQQRIVFSSSASVYGVAEGFGVTESSATAPASPYARTKLVMEMALRDITATGSLRAIILRYFNPVGADPTLRSGVHVREPSHVLEQLVRAAAGRQEAFRLTGTDFPTRDGTGLRDYIHVWDLARAHVSAVERFEHALARAAAPSLTLNVGTGKGVTVKELVGVFEQVFGSKVPVHQAPARPGDPAGAFARVELIRDLLGWEAELTLADAIASSLAWSERRVRVLGYP